MPRRLPRLEQFAAQVPRWPIGPKIAGLPADPLGVLHIPGAAFDAAITALSPHEARTKRERALCTLAAAAQAALKTGSQTNVGRRNAAALVHHPVEAALLSGLALPRDLLAVHARRRAGLGPPGLGITRSCGKYQRQCAGRDRNHPYHVTPSSVETNTPLGHPSR